MGKKVPTDCSIDTMVGDKLKQMLMDDQAKMLIKAEENFKQMSMKKK